MRYKVIKEMFVIVDAKDECEATEIAEDKFDNGNFEIHPYIEEYEDDEMEFNQEVM